MPTYAAILGHQPQISLAELSATVADMKVTKMIGKQIAIFESAQELGNKDLEKWGGVFLIAKQVSDKSADTTSIPQLLVDQTKNVRGKITFSIRAYNMPHATVHDWYRKGKDLLKKQGKAVRYIGNERKPAATVLLHNQGLLEGKHGCELLVINEEKFFWVGRTTGVQDPDAYTKRDMEKPVRDTRVGLLPPKLAQILLNLGQWAVREANPKAPKTLTVYDPFCGTGVIPIECLLRGWPVMASDLSLKAVNGCDKNLEWIRKVKNILKKDTASAVWKHDATKPFDLEDAKPNFKDPPHMIVTETTLGPGLTDRPTAKDAAKMKTECEAIEIAFLKNAAAAFPGVPVIATFPIWYLKSGPLMLEKVWKQLEEIGYKAVLPKGIKGDVVGKNSLIYRRPDQMVGRELVILKPVKR